ncbi:MAG TPA: GC-type dockerin domain-anchored protein [Phycisphaerales bacterium]|nr:GC-type dockerin domain-anchored protein [Phycisphaerales bacterium]
MNTIHTSPTNAIKTRPARSPRGARPAGRGRALAAPLLALGLMAGTAAAATETYSFTIAPGAASGNAAIAGSTNLSGTVIGNHDPVTNPGGTMTRPNLFGLCSGTTNTAFPFSATGSSSGSTALSPSGTFAVTVNPTAGTSSVSGLSLDLLGPSDPSFPTSSSISFPTSFRTCQPTGIFPAGTYPVPLGNLVVSEMTAAQTAPATGTLTPTGTPGQYTFAVAVPVEVTTTYALGSIPATESVAAAVVPLAGTITVSGCTATVSFAIDVEANETIAGPVAGPQDVPLDVPNIGGTAHLLADTQIDSVSFTADVTGSGSAPGQIVFKPGDFNRDCVVNTADISAFLAAWFADLANGTHAADFNADGVTNTSDITAFLSAWFAGLN